MRSLRIPLAWAVLILAGCGPKLAPVDAGSVDSGLGDDAGVGDGGIAACAPIPEPTCKGAVPTFGDLSPIFVARCQGCHDGQPSGPWPLVTYENVTDWQDTVRSEIVLCTMPPQDAGVPITYQEREAIFTWLRCGRPR